MKEIKNQIYSHERALYLLKDTVVTSCRFEGEEDGESPFKESSNIVVNDCYFALRYPFWHVNNGVINLSKFAETSRAAFWYDEKLTINNCLVLSPKALRESKDITLVNSTFSGKELAWRCTDIKINSCSIEGEYVFFMSKNINIDTLSLKGKYSFQYVEDLVINNAYLDTKDAFWHTKNVKVYNSVIIGQYIAWYAENITFINCKIKGTQPFCYTKGLKLINCEMEDADLAFEYSEVDADINSELISIKNPLKGIIRVKGVKEIIKSDSKYPSECKIIQK